MLQLNDYIWSIAHNLVKNHDFSLVEIKEEANITQETSGLHLIKNIRREYIYIRLTPVNFVWPNHLEQDISATDNYAASILKQQFGQKMKFLNLYIFQTNPSDEVTSIIQNKSRLTSKNLEVYTGYINLEKEQLGLPEDTFTSLRLNKEPFTYYFSNPIEQTNQQKINDMKVIENNRRKETMRIFSHGKPILTYIIIGINTLLFLLMTLAGGSTETEVLLKFGAKESFLISQGEYWRILTPVFLHIGFLHFALNNIALYYLGVATEKIYGSYRFFLIYIIAGIVGNVSSVVFMPSHVGAGASGAIFGLFGALLYFGYVYSDLFFRTMGKDVLTILAINIVFGIVVQSVDIYAHLGGLLGGFLVAALLGLPKQTKKTIMLKVISAFLIVAIFAVGYWGINIRDFKGSPQLYLVGEEAIQNREIDKAYDIFDHLTKAYPEEALFHFYYANTVFQKGDLDLAMEHYNTTLALEPNFAEAHYKLALIYNINEDYGKAIYHLEEALEINPDFSDAEYLLGELKRIQKTK